jgi:chloramphenicol 3-O-phosphotransferase
MARLRSHETVIVDDTGSPRFLRDGWRWLCSSLGARMVLVFVETSEEVIRRRLMDNRVSRHPATDGQGNGSGRPSERFRTA